MPGSILTFAVVLKSPITPTLSHNPDPTPATGAADDTLMQLEGMDNMDAYPFPELGEIGDPSQSMFSTMNEPASVGQSEAESMQTGKVRLVVVVVVGWGGGGGGG